MRIVNSSKAELALLGLITGIFLGSLSREFKVGLLIALFYLLFQYLPYIPWIILVDEGVLVKYVVINSLGLFLNPGIYYFMNIIGFPINLALLISISLFTFMLGIIFYRFRSSSLELE
jgi:hypothetical protein